jgi:hypothetical protein
MFGVLRRMAMVLGLLMDLMMSYGEIFNLDRKKDKKTELYTTISGYLSTSHRQGKQPYTQTMRVSVVIMLVGGVIAAYDDLAFDALGYFLVLVDSVVQILQS